MDGYNNLVNNTKIELCLIGGMLGLTVISGALASSIRVNADDITDITDTASVTVPTSCSMTATIDSEHSASIPNGIYSGTELYPNGIGKTTIATFCNDNSGYAIYAIGFTGDKYDGEDHTKLIGNTTNEKITTGTATSGSTSNWAMKLTKETDTSASYNPANLTITNGYDDYSAVPDTYTKVANYTSTTDLTLGSVLSTTYAAYITSTQVADTYVGKVKYTLVHPNTEVPAQPQTTQTGKIHYYANVSDYEGTMADQDIAASVTLLPSNFSRTGYGFAGWSDKFNYATNPEAKFYGPMETITLNTADYTGTNPGLSLYAVWVKSQGNLQDSTKVASVCNSLTTAPIDGTANLSSVSALTDQRDNNTYAIAKLADGKCWMIENLRLADKDSNNNDIELSITNTNNPSLPITNIYDATNPTTSNHLSVSINPTTTAWCRSENVACFDQSMLYTGNTTERANTPASNANTYSYGNYYNWYSATAGNGTYNYGISNNSVDGDLCPAGWRLPKGGDKTRIESNADNEFWNLTVVALNNNALPVNYASSTNPYYDGASEAGPVDKALRTYPNNYLYTGYVDSGSLLLRGSGGLYWSSTARAVNYARDLYLDSSAVYPGSRGGNKFFGRAVRCIAQ